MTRSEGLQTGTLDEAYEALKRFDSTWLETTLLQRWQQIAATTSTAAHSDRLIEPKSPYLGPHDVTAPGFRVTQGYLARFKAHDWSTTALGPISSWSPELRRMVNMCMADPRSVAIWWGPGRVCLHNESYQGVLGSRKSWALGKSVNEVWYDVDSDLDRFKGAFDKVDVTGQPSFGEDTCFFVERSGFLEEVWASWAVLPILGHSGNLGYYNTVSESTARVLHDRRMATLLTLEQQTDRANDLTELWQKVLVSLESNAEDVPFAALFSTPSEVHSRHSSVSSGASPASDVQFSTQWVLEDALESTSGLGLPPVMGWDLAVETLGPLFTTAIGGRTMQRLTTKDNTFPSPLAEKSHSRLWNDLCTSALIIPISGRQRPSNSSFLLLGLNPRSAYDKDYQRFTALVSSQLRRSFETICIAMDEARHAAMASELASQEHALLAERLNMSELDANHKEARFRMMADQALVGIYEVGADGKLKYANKAWFDMTGFPHGDLDDLAPLEWASVIHPEDREWFAAQWGRLTGGETLQFEIRFCKPYVSDDFIDGRRLEGVTWAAAAAYAERDPDGTVKNVLGSVTDISRHKWMESLQERRTAEALELKRQQEAFMDMTSHEARNPLAAISLCVESILDTCEHILAKSGDQVLISRDTVDTMLDGANTIMACVSHQKSIIDDVLTLSKLKSGMLQTTLVETQPLHEISQALKVFESELQQCDIELDFIVEKSYDEQQLDFVLLDPVRLRQILINLLTNAIKFTKTEASRHITVSLASRTSRPGRSDEGVEYLHDVAKPVINSKHTYDTVYLLVTVKDTGCGIDESELTSLFQRFQQASPKTHVKYGGSGLGLFICKELARLQGGQIGVASTLGSGSTFTFYVQATKCAPPKTDQLARSTSNTPRKIVSGAVLTTKEIDNPTNAHITVKPPNDCHILLVEDNLVNQRVMAKQLQRAGYAVAIANHGQEALDHLSGTHFSKEGGEGLDVVLMDIEMPVMDGLECTRRIRQMELQGELNRTIPLIAVTANARTEQQKEALDAGVNAVITKPFRMGTLLPELERYCLAQG